MQVTKVSWRSWDNDLSRKLLRTNWSCVRMCPFSQSLSYMMYLALRVQLFTSKKTPLSLASSWEDVMLKQAVSVACIHEQSGACTLHLNHVLLGFLQMCWEKVMSFLRSTECLSGTKPLTTLSLSWYVSSMGGQRKCEAFIDLAEQLSHSSHKTHNSGLPKSAWG